MKASISGHSALFVLACIFVWATIFLSCLAAIAQTDPGAGAEKSIGNAFVPVPAPAPRKALVIVAGKYANGAFPSLPSAKKDFDKMSEKLRDLGFHDRDIIPSLDEPAAAVWQKIKSFQGKLEEGDLAVVYFSGHGFQFGGLNYFAPVDAPEQLINNDVTEKVVPLSNVLLRLSQKEVGLGFIILDTCRVNNVIVQDPQEISRNAGTGLGEQQDVSSGMVIAYATAYGKTACASEDPNENSLYTQYLIEKIGSKGEHMLDILRKVDSAVETACDKKYCKQRPTFQAYSASFYPDRSDETLKLDRAVWANAHNAKDECTINDLKNMWPVSEYAKSARQWLADNRDKARRNGIFLLVGKGNRFTDLLPLDKGYRVIRGEDLAAPMIATPADSSEGHPAIVAVDNMKVFDQESNTALQIATLQKGEPVWIDLDDLKNKGRNPEKGLSIWSKISAKVGREGRSIVGYVKDAVRIDDYVPYEKRCVIKLKPVNEADVLDLEAVLVSSLDGKDLPEPKSLTEAIASKSSGLLSKTALSQSSIVVELHNYIEGSRSVERARKLSSLRALQIRNSLIVSGARAEKIFIKMPKEFLLEDKGRPDHDEITLFIMSGIPPSAEDAPRDTGSPGPAAEVLQERGSIPFRDAVERYNKFVRTDYIAKIKNGVPAYFEDHKWQAALLRLPENIPFCGGSLVRNNWVVTAAHCVYDAQYGEVHAPGMQDVLTGTEDLSSSKGKRLGVEAIYVHEKFKHKTYNNRGIPVNDIALLQLKGDGIGEPIKPLTEKEEPRIVVSNQKAMIAGWGKTTEKGSASLQLMQADVPLVDRSKCNGQGAYDGTVEDNMLCAGTDDGSQDSCTGDSGGPMTKSGFLIGLVSWPGDACGQAFQYGVYTRVSQFADWIEACINDPGACKSMKKLSNGNTSQ